jgi:GTP diphosphokinase / guanosine-3',5'-bis(diphosphate) 3'-diphosphatase
MLQRALRAEGFSNWHEDAAAIWERLLRFTGNKTRDDLLTDIGLGKRIATIVARRMASLIAETGAKPDPVLLSQARFAQTDEAALTSVQLDGSEGASVMYAACCTPVPGDVVHGYLGRGEALTVHRVDCATGAKLRQRDRERFVEVQWSDTPSRSFNTRLRVSVRNGQGVLARIAAQIAQTEADIAHIDMGQEIAQDATDLVFTIGVRDREHLDAVQGVLKRVPAVFSVSRI